MKETMNSRERMQAAFALQPVDRVPVTQGDCGSWIAHRSDMSLADLYSLDDLGASLIVEAFQDMQLDTCEAGVGCIFGMVNAVGCPIDMSRIGAPVEVSPCIKDPAIDVPKLDKSKIKAHIANNELLQKCIRQIQLVKEAVGEEKWIYAPMVGPFTAVNLMVGTEDFMVMMAEEDENIPALIDYAVEFCAEVASLYFAHGVDSVYVADPNSSGDLISQTMFEDVVMPAMQDFIAQIRHKGNVYCHICGHTSVRLPSVSQLDIQGFSIDSVVDMQDTLAALSGKMAAIGNIDPSGMMLMGTPEQVYAESYRLVEMAGLEGGFILCLGCGLPAGSSLENLNMMHKAACDYAAAQK
jgi:MtaA/CmuA family methyltransferase